MKDKRKNIRKIGALVIFGMFISVLLVQGGLAETWGGYSTNDSYYINIDQNNSIDDEAFGIFTHGIPGTGIELFRVQEDGRVGIEDIDPDFKLEVAVSSGDGYFGVSSAADNDGDIFIVDNNGNVGIGTTSPISKLSVAGEATIGSSSWATTNRAPSNGMLVEGKVKIGTISASNHVLTVASSDEDTLRLIGPDLYGAGARLNFGDWDRVYLEEDVQDKLYIYGHYGTSIMGGDVGIGTTSPGAKLDVEVSSGAAATIGRYNSAIGGYAIALGYSTTASGGASIAMGSGTIASGNKATAMGDATIANADTATAMGSETTASGPYSTAMGWHTTASGSGSIAMGGLTRASGSYSTAMGWYTTASGSYSTAMGYQISVSGEYSFGIDLGSYQHFTVSLDHTMAIMGGKIGIGTVSPGKLLHLGNDLGDINGEIRFEASDGKIVDLVITTDDQLKITGGSLYVDDDVIFGAGPTELTISSGVVTATHSYHRIAVESDTEDDLDTISGGDVAGQILIIRAYDSDKTITVRDESVSSGNIILFDDTQFELNHVDDTLTLIYDGSNWLELSRSSNSD